MNAKRNIRIAYVISQYPAISHTFILREIRHLKKFGVDVSVASINNPDRPSNELTLEEQEEANKTFYVKRRGFLGAIKAHADILVHHPFSYLRGLVYSLRLGGTDLYQIIYGGFYFVEAIMIIQWMKKENLNHLHVHFATQAATVALIASQVSPIIFSMTVHGPTEFYDTSRFYLPEKIKRTSFICCISQYARSQLMMLSDFSQWEKVELCRLGVDVNVYTSGSFRKHPSPFQITCVGRLTPEKGQHILLAAIDRLVHEGRNIKLCLVGDGPERTRLEMDVKIRRLSEKIIFKGAVNQDNIREIYASSDLFVLPSFAEGLPVVLMEAMATEIPCVATRITGVPEIIRDGIDGVLVPPSDEKEIAMAISKLIDNDELRYKLGRAGRQRIQDMYNIEKNVPLLVEVFTKRLSEENPHEQ